MYHFLHTLFAGMWWRLYFSLLCVVGVWNHFPPDSLVFDTPVKWTNILRWVTATFGLLSCCGACDDNNGNQRNTVTIKTILCYFDAFIQTSSVRLRQALLVAVVAVADFSDRH